MKLTDEEEAALLAEAGRRLNEIRARFEGSIMGPGTVPALEAAVRDVLGWVNSVLPPTEYDVDIKSWHESSGVHFSVTAKPRGGFSMSATWGE